MTNLERLQQAIIDAEMSYGDRAHIAASIVLVLESLDSDIKGNEFLDECTAKHRDEILFELNGE